MYKFGVDIQRKYVFIVLASLFFLAVVYRFFPFFQELVSPGQEIELLEGKLIKYRKMVLAGKNQAKQLDTLNKNLNELESRLLTGRTPSLAAVDIQKMMHEIAGKSQVQIRRVKVLNPKGLDQKDYFSIPVEFFIFSTIRQLKEILYRIETTEKFLMVEKITANYYTNQVRLFRCYITITGFMRTTKN